MTVATRALAGLAAWMAVSGASVELAPGAAAEAGGQAVIPADLGLALSQGGTAKQTPPRERGAKTKLVVTIDRLGSSVLRKGQPVVVRGTLTNPSKVPWLDAQAYLQMSYDPARTLAGLEGFAEVPADTGLGVPNYTLGEFARVGSLEPGQSRRFTVQVPYAHLSISGDSGVYRLGIKVIASTPEGVRDIDDAARANTLLPLLAPPAASPVPVQAVTLLPMVAPVKRLHGGGAFADNSLVRLLSMGGRLSNVVSWALAASPRSVQVVIDPALLAAVTDMADGYRVDSASSAATGLGGHGQVVAARWLTQFRLLEDQQYVMLLPWGTPAADSLLANGLPGPLTAAVKSSRDFVSRGRGVSAVAGWLTGGRMQSQALSVLRRAGTDVQLVPATSLPGLRGDRASGALAPSRVDMEIGHRRLPLLVVGTTLAGLPTTASTSALQLRQRLLADALARSLSEQTDQVLITALPFRWDPGPARPGQSFADRFGLPLVVGQSLIGALDRPGQRYDGVLRPGPLPDPGLPVQVIAAIRALQVTGGNLASILSPSRAAERAFQRSYAMAGSRQWRKFPLTGAELINRQAAAAHESLAKVTVTGPPFVAMSSDSGRFPLTVTNGLDEPISIGLAVIPEDPALQIGPLSSITLPPGQRRDIQVVTTAEGSGVTSVRARVATASGEPFGVAWQFDVRATQIGLVIWIVMGVGGAVLFIAAGYRIVNRLRGNPIPRRQTTV